MEMRSVLIADDLLKILVCPKTRQPLRVAPLSILERINQRIAAKEVHNQEGQPVTEPLEEALVTEDGAWLYPVRDGIPVMLIGESIALEAQHEA